MRWFRFYSDAPEDPKVQRLPGDLFKTWVNLLCLANKSEERGCLPSTEDIAFALRLDLATATAHLDELAERGLLDGDDDRRTPHNWAGRQKASDDVTARVHQHRNKAKQSETLQERSGNALDLDEEKTRVDTDQSRPEESERRASARPPAAETTPDPKRADARPPRPSADELVAQLADWATAKGVRQYLEPEAERFVNHCEAGKNGKPVVYANYARALQNWITNPDYGPTARAPARASPNGPHPSTESAKFGRSLSALQQVGGKRG